MKNNKKQNIVIIGAGLAGLAAAWKLSKLADDNVTVLEKEDYIGGLAATVSFGDWRMDLGSHRIHPGYMPEVLSIIRDLVGEKNLIMAKRNGRLFLKGNSMDYPPSLGGFFKTIGPLDLSRCALSFLAERGRALTRKANGNHSDYESYLLSKAGRYAYDLFYAPYARKVYGIDPNRLSAKAAKLRLVLRRPHDTFRFKGASKPDSRYYFYPPEGFGGISDAICKRAVGNGAQVVTGAAVREIFTSGKRVCEIAYETSGLIKRLPVDRLISTIPINKLPSFVMPGAPKDVVDAAGSLQWRGVRLLQVILKKEKALQGETYYFPEERYVFGRISEPGQFSPGLSGGVGETALNIEVIATPGDAIWNMTEKVFFQTVVRDIESLGIFRREEVLKSRSIKLPDVYPVLDLNYKNNLNVISSWARSFENLSSTGRGGIYFHGNADHSIHLGLQAAESVLFGEGSFERMEDAPEELFMVRD